MPSRCNKNAWLANRALLPEKDEMAMYMKDSPFFTLNIQDS